MSKSSSGTLRKYFLVPVLVTVFSLLLYMGAIAAYVQYADNSNANAIKASESHAIAVAIENNNKTLCEVIVPLNEASKNSTDANTRTSSYSLKLKHAFFDLNEKYQCGG